MFYCFSVGVMQMQQLIKLPYNSLHNNKPPFIKKTYGSNGTIIYKMAQNILQVQVRFVTGRLDLTRQLKTFSKFLKTWWYTVSLYINTNEIL